MFVNYQYLQAAKDSIDPGNSNVTPANSSCFSGGCRPSEKEGGGHPDPEIRGRGEARSQNCVFVFLVLRASVWSKNKVRAPPLDPLYCVFRFPSEFESAGFF